MPPRDPPEVIERVRRLYLELKAVRRVHKASGVPEDRVQRYVADLVPQVRAETRQLGARVANARRAERFDAGIRALAWRCQQCGARAQGPTCAQGHPAPWNTENLADLRTVR